MTSDKSVADFHFNNDESFGFIAEEREFTTFCIRRVRACSGHNGKVIVMEHNGWSVASVDFQARSILYIKDKPFTPSSKPSVDEEERLALGGRM